MFDRKPSDLAKFYKDNKSKEKPYYTAIVARPKVAEEGETPDTLIELTQYFNFHARKKSIITVPDFVQAMENIGNLPAPAPKKDLPDDTSLLATARSLPIIVEDENKDPRRIKAPHDGVIVQSDVLGYLYLSNYELTSVFNYKGPKNQSHPEGVFRRKSDPVVKGIILDKPATIALPSGIETIPAGSFIAPDGRGSYAIHPPEYANLALRKKPEALDPVVGLKDKALKFLRIKI